MPWYASADFTALQDISLELEQGAFWTILGPSGCGKSTMLRLVSDLVPAAAGEVSVLGKSTEEARLAREFAFVFQDATLLPWRTALKNVELPLEIGRRRNIRIPGQRPVTQGTSGARGPARP